jgi:hypothetical protein
VASAIARGTDMVPKPLALHGIYHAALGGLPHWCGGEPGSFKAW